MRALTIDVAPGDPLRSFLRAAPGVVGLDALPARSAAAGRMAEQGVRVVVPLVASGELVGLLALGARLSERGYSREDRRLLDALARYAAPALRLGQLARRQEAAARSLERLEAELEIAEAVQRQFLPRRLPRLPGWRVSALYRPARRVGGDFYDVIDLGAGRVMVVAGDVSDKGVPASLVMASTHALLDATARAGNPPGEVLATVNDLLCRQTPAHMFVTCLALALDTRTGAVLLANAGHNLPAVRRSTGVEELPARGLPLGLLPGSTYEEHETVLRPGDLALLYSDGLTEQHDVGGQMFGTDRVTSLIANASSCVDLVDRSTAALAAFATGADQEDDVTMLALQRLDGADRDDVVRLSVPSVVGAERAVMARVEAATSRVLPPERLEALLTAVSESVMNAVEHGNQGRECLAVDVLVQVGRDDVVVEVTDFGRGRHGPAPPPDLNLKLAGLQPPRGWGLFLVEQLVDRVEEIVDGDRHTVILTLTTHRRR